jgi:hypothetical protein
VQLDPDQLELIACNGLELSRELRALLQERLDGQSRDHGPQGELQLGVERRRVAPDFQDGALRIDHLVRSGHTRLDGYAVGAENFLASDSDLCGPDVDLLDPRETGKVPIEAPRRSGRG